MLELNPKHPLVERLRDATGSFDDWATLLFEQALLAEGGHLDEPAAFVRRLNAMLLNAGT